MAEQVDELFDVKSAFYVGAYQQCIKNCQTARLSDPALAVEKDGYMYRAYLAQGKYAVITDEIKPSAPRSLQHLVPSPLTSNQRPEVSPAVMLSRRQRMRLERTICLWL